MGVPTPQVGVYDTKNKPAGKKGVKGIDPSYPLPQSSLCLGEQRIDSKQLIFRVTYTTRIGMI